MKPLIVLFGTIVACAMGYMLEPQLRPYWAPAGAGPLDAPVATTESPAAKPAAPPVEPKEPAETVAEKPPESITLTSEIEFKDETSGLVIRLAAGSRVKLLAIKGDQAVIRPGETNYSVSVPLAGTDWGASSSATEAPLPEPAVELERAPAPEPETATSGEMPAASLPETPAAVPPASVAVPSQPQGVVAIMQQSIRAGEIKEFSAGQILNWQAGPAETLNGEVFQTGIVTYKAETIFGEKTIQAKALIKDGRVVRWVWPKSGMIIQ